MTHPLVLATALTISLVAVVWLVLQIRRWKTEREALVETLQDIGRVMLVMEERLKLKDDYEKKMELAEGTPVDSDGLTSFILERAPKTGIYGKSALMLARALYGDESCLQYWQDRETGAYVVWFEGEAMDGTIYERPDTIPVELSRVNGHRKLNGSEVRGYYRAIQS